MAGIEYDRETVDRLTDRVDDAIDAVPRLAVLAAHGHTAEESPVDHGLLAGSFQIVQVGDREWVVFSRLAYGPYVQYGTGIYGPRRRRITPTHAQALRFEIDGQVVFARSVAGQRPNPFLTRATRRTRDQSAQFLRMALAAHA